MRVFVAHAAADQVSADELKAVLKQRGLMVETEDGSRGFSFLVGTDVVVALWSQKSVFDVRQMQLQGRMLDAWAEGRLVLVKLDNGFLPVGLRDLSFIDASFEAARSTGSWMQVAARVQELRRRAMASDEVASMPRPIISPGRGSPTGGIGDGEPREQERQRSVGAAPPMPSPAPSRKAAKRVARGAPAVLWHLVAILVVALIGAALIWFEVPNAVPIVLILAGLTLIVPFALFRGSSKRKAASVAMRAPPEADKDEAGEAPVMLGRVEPLGNILFISYAHADNAQVEPVVKIVEANGREVWIDKGGIPAGEGWAGEIVRAIKTARAVIVMCSRRAFESDHIKREVYLADRYKKPMLPVFIEEAAPPEDFEYFFASVQWLELFKLPEADRAGAMARALQGV